MRLTAASAVIRNNAIGRMLNSSAVEIGVELAFVSVGLVYFVSSISV
jgi:hypothetical protein